MADTARLDELERKFAENPRRYFAPLANEYRKSGDLATAIRLCREQLSRFPGHMSGHVVLGQALYESRQPEDAQRSFERALELDPENLIALRHLGDIARDRGDGNAARGWYQRVLEADPRNDDIAAQLQQLAPAAQRYVAPAPEPMASVPVAPSPPPAPVLEPLEWSSLDLDLPGSTTAHETAELPIASEPALDAPSAEPQPVESMPEAPVAEAEPQPDALLDLDDEEFGLPLVTAAPAAEPAAPTPPVEQPMDVPAVLDEAPTAALDPVDWAELLPDETEGEPEAPAAVEPAIVAEPEAIAEPEAEDDGAVITTIEEVWLPAATSAAVEVEDEPAPEAPAAEEPVVEEAVADEPVAEEAPLAVESGDALDLVPWDVEALPALAEDEVVAEAAAPAEPTVAEEPEVAVESEAAPDETPHVPMLAVLPETAPEPEVEIAASEAGWVEAAPLDLAPELLEVVEPAHEATVEWPLAEDAGVELLEPAVEAAAEPVPEATYDPVVGLDLPPIASDELEPYPAAAEERRGTPGAGVPSVPFVTETMAGLLLRQGHLDQALEVYEQLAAQRPDDDALSARVADLRASLQPPTQEPEPASEPAPVPETPAGASAGAFFAALVAGGAASTQPEPVGQPVAEPEPAPAAEAPTAPAAPAAPVARGLLAGDGAADDERAARRLADAFSASASPMTSLADALFVSAPSLPAAATPPAPPPPPAEEVPYGLGDFSFERFFEGLEEGAPADEGAPSTTGWGDADLAASARPEPARPATPDAPMRAVEEAPAPAAAPAPAPVSDEEDLAQFHAWLKGLMEP